ncbi:MAG: flagellar protein FlgN [Methyloprofundus sp.]|nr:flagellar protein FlgN [Methyloprofundus sp.]MDT8425560.1 flagellar protein FlgN [Methyloprofundus sp.]
MIHKTHPLATKLIATALNNTQQLYQLLNEESILLKAKGQTQALDLIVQKKNALVSELNTFTSQVEQLLASEKLSKQDGMIQYFAIAKQTDIDTTESLSNWQKLSELSKKCRTLNEQNGASIHILNQHTQRILSILKGKPQTTNTYSRDGRAKSTPYSRTLVSV